MYYFFLSLPKCICKTCLIFCNAAGGYLLARTMAILLVMTLATSMAARQGAIRMAGHQICLQIWLAASLLSDSIALAGQVHGRHFTLFIHVVLLFYRSLDCIKRIR